MFLEEIIIREEQNEDERQAEGKTISSVIKTFLATCVFFIAFYPVFSFASNNLPVTMHTSIFSPSYSGKTNTREHDEQTSQLIRIIHEPHRWKQGITESSQ